MRGDPELARLAVALAVCIALACIPFGCGPSKGQTYHVENARVFFDLKDAEDGGDANRTFHLAAERRITWIKMCDVKVLKPGDDWTKVEVMDTDKRGTTGWVETKLLSK